jgi:hypothetical protein
METPEPNTAEIEAVVRRYMARVARRYAPLGVGLLALLLVVAVVPSKSPTSSNNNAALGETTGGNGTQVAAGSGQTTADTAAAGPGATTAGSTGSAGTGGHATRTTAPLPKQITPPATAGSHGITRSGVECGPGVPQASFTVYSPLCIPKYTGNNGGNTFHGVTADTITAVFRRTNSAEEKAAFAATGSAAPGTDDQYLADFRTYIDYFNTKYELYGRHVVVADYTGQGDNLQEDQGQNLGGAQTDADTARDMNAFMDLSSSPTLASTQPYEEDLANDHVIAIGAVGLPKSWFKHFAPYEYTIAPDGTSAVAASVHALCRRQWNQNAIYAGDAAYQATKRGFGLVTPDNTEYQELGTELKTGIKAECGASFAYTHTYAINLQTMGSDSVTIASQMHSNNPPVTSAICICDPVFEIFLSQAADNQQYHPEWYPTPWLDPQGRETAANQWSHAIAGQWIYFPPKAQDEAYKVFKLIKPNEEPQEQYYAEAYWTALYIFDLLQQAGPNLTPATFQQAAFSLPQTGRGMFGTWHGAPESYSPTTEVQIGYYDVNAISNMDGKAGAWVPCDSGSWYSLTDPNSWGQAGTQFHCYGK